MTSLPASAPSGSTRGDFGDFPRALSAATTGAEDVLAATRPEARRTFVWEHFGPLMIATVVPFAALDDLLFRLRRETATTLSYVISASEEDWLLREQPDVLVVEPRRTTLKFRSGGRARRLPPRTPFVSVSDFDDA